MDDDKDAMVLHRDDPGLPDCGIDCDLRHLSEDDVTAIFEEGEAEEEKQHLWNEEEPPTENIHDLVEQARWGNNYAIYRLACIYLDENRPEYNRDRGEDLIFEAAESGNGWAQYRVGQMCFYGVFFQRNLQISEHWLREASDNGNTYAMTFLGRAQMEGNLLGNREEGLRMLIRAEAAGNPDAALALGRYYMRGENTKRDLGQAIAHFACADRMGNFWGSFYLAEACLFEGGLQDYQKAVDSLYLSARQGNLYALNALRRLRHYGGISAVTNLKEVLGELENMDSEVRHYSHNERHEQHRDFSHQEEVRRRDDDGPCL